MKYFYDTYQSPLGLIHIILDETGVFRVELTSEGWQRFVDAFGMPVHDQARCAEVIRQVDLYFHGKTKNFSLPLSIQGPAFSQKVWQELRSIPYGETRSYAEVARALGKPNSCRAVGQANRRNPLPIIIPCHRVIGKNGAMTGYIGKGYIGLKEQLLELERENR
jgi:methylated-DNA-[protein]-cysteine S-methyltransferase